MYYTVTNTPAGNLLCISDGTTITGMHWEVFKRTPVVGVDWIEDERPFQEALGQLDEYFTGTRQDFDFNYVAKGTEFQMSVWRELAKISYGTKSSYSEIAKLIGRPKAVRAVGTAVGSNPISIVVPCHRVLTSAGQLGGYAGGLESKMRLLRIEGIVFSGAADPSTTI